MILGERNGRTGQPIHDFFDTLVFSVWVTNCLSSPESVGLRGMSVSVRTAGQSRANQDAGRHSFPLTSRSWRQCSTGQQDAPHPSPPAARHPQGRGAQQAAGQSAHRPGRRHALHPGCAAAQEDSESVVLLVPQKPRLGRASHRRPVVVYFWTALEVREGRRHPAGRWTAKRPACGPSSQ